MVGERPSRRRARADLLGGIAPYNVAGKGCPVRILHHLILLAIVTCESGESVSVLLLCGQTFQESRIRTRLTLATIWV